MKIKTITCHEVYNHGASLQEYALLKYLEHQGHQAETIRYKPDYLSNHFNLWRVSNEKYEKNLVLKIVYLLAKLPSRLQSLKRKREFDAFSKAHIKATTARFKTNLDLKANPPKADAYICGSDQIWNSFFQNGKDPAFYLDFAPDDSLKISYAASFAIDKLEEDIKGFVQRQLSRLDHISVRESSGLRIVRELGIKQATQVLDPVFLLDKQEWETLIDKKLEQNPYLLVYDFDSNPWIQEMAEQLQQKHGWKIITVNQNIDYANSNYFLNGPLQFLSLLRHAQFVISNSFHAVAFSIIFRKKFVVFNRMDKINTRMRDLLASIDLPELLIHSRAQALDWVPDTINYAKAESKLEQLISHSKTYLTQALRP